MLGAWHVHALEYAEMFNENQESMVTCVWDDDAVRGQEFASEIGVPFEADLSVLLSRPDVDAVCVSTATNIHEEVMVASANAKKHIFTEKVLATTLQAAQNIKDAVLKNDVKFTISYPHQSMPHNLLAKKVLDEGLLGTVTYLRIRNAHSGASDGWLPEHFYNAVECGGGAMIDLGAHPMYLINWLIGLPTEMASAFTHVTGKSVEDNAVSMMKYDNGLIAISETGFVTNASPFVLEIHGTAGSFVYNGTDVSLTSNTLSEKSGYSGTIKPQELPAAAQHPIDNFVATVLHEASTLYGIDDAVNLTKLMVAAYKAHESGGFVKL